MIRDLGNEYSLEKQEGNRRVSGIMKNNKRRQDLAIMGSAVHDNEEDGKKETVERA